MASLFCPQCGAKNMYTLKKPNFCQGCGETFSAFGMGNPAPQQSNAELSSTEESIPNISKLQYELDIPKNNVNSFESLVSNPIKPEDVSYSAGAVKKRKKMTKEEFLKQSQAECSSSRGRFTDIGGGGE